MFGGSIVAIVTPMFPDGRIDYDSFEKLVEFHIENKTDAIVAVGTTGESSTVNFDEHRDVVKRVVQYVRGRVPVIAGTGGNSTEEAVRLTHWAAEDGADACLLVAPYYNKPPQEGLYQHFKLIAETVDIPQILYNVPGRTASDILPDTVEKLANLKNIVAIKEASTFERVEQLIRRVGDKIDVLTGEDGIAAKCVLAGAKGVISVTANLVPLQMHEMIQAALNGDEARAYEINEKIKELHHVLFLEANPIPVKWALQEMKKIHAGIRLPLVPLDKQYHLTVREAMKNAGIL